MKAKTEDIIISITAIIFLAGCFYGLLYLTKDFRNREWVCIDEQKVISVETTVSSNVWGHKKFYHYTFENGDKEIRGYKVYTVGEIECLKKELK